MSPDKPRARAKYCKDNKDCGSLTVQEIIEIIRKWSRRNHLSVENKEFYFESGKLAFLTKFRENLII